MKKCIVLLSLFVLCGNSSAHAQVPPPIADAEAVHRDALWDNYRIERQIQQNRVQSSGVVIGTPQPQAPDLDGKSSERVFKLNEVVFDQIPHSIRRHELDAVVERYKAQEKVSIRDLYEMLNEIDSLFDKRHVVGRAVLPVQEVADGVIYVQIIEGRVGRTTITTKRQPYPLLEGKSRSLVPVYRPFGRNFVRKQYHYPSGKVLNTEELEEEILRFNRKFRTQLIAELEPGNELGRSNVKLTAVAPQPISAGYYSDNSGRDTSGKYRNGFFVNLQSVLGLDESFYYSYDETKGTSFLTMYGDIPVTACGTWIEMSYDYGTPQTISGPYVDLNITGTSRRYRPGVRQLLWNTKERRGELSFNIEGYESQTFFDNIVNYRERLVGYSIGLTSSYRRTKSFRSTTLSYVLGNAGTGGNPILDGDLTYEHYHLLRANLTQVWYPNKKWTWIGKIHGQWALSNLPQSQIFQIGGMATVRGVSEGMMSGESGYFLGLEGRRFLSSLRKNGRLEAFGFFDHGGVFYRNALDEMRPSDFLFSVGCGLMGNWGKYVSAVGGYGQPIFTSESHAPAYRHSLRNGRAYFTVRVQF